MSVAIAAAAVLVLLGGAAWFALGVGERRGRAAERERHRRAVHDTVLQVMEALALPAPADVVDPVGSLDRVRRTAREHALRLRLSLDNLSSPDDPAGLVPRLRALTAELAADGLAAEVVELSALGDLPEATVDTLHGAAREALRNTLKHSGTRRAVVSVEAGRDGVSVTIRDHGTGFRPENRRRGFGIEHSIVGRLTEIGGDATIDSAPGEGTRVRLRAPLALRLPVG
ncbi:sensor histidine kinase [Amycolatopsis saalfeldensis]|uniref:Histidine kinase-, DNA gyrase B-, and HSP90-like ATPase n=1 Tax=Amycolatopsis saalfeldensis TaxID=394193 RepID=A0A1H8Y2Y3_9PSEU|nr:ATP-binding protein [Amycolatopsis saalfeldensis]SEP46422.1 Histidine kinase-, DNA gyrase B-, and HSP90-like ATPase [Amycolatopsis saalfeldensis]